MIPILQPKHVLIGLLSLPFVLFSIEFVRVAITDQIWEWQGYHVTHDSRKVARIAVEKNDPKECWKLRNSSTYLRLAPGNTEDVNQTSCLYQAAELSKDPSFCADLMPSRYGEDCIQSAMPVIEGPYPGVSCTDEGEKMLCYSSDQQFVKHIVDIVIDYSKCNEISDISTRDWCYIGRVRAIPEERDCSKVQLNQQRKDHCLYTVAKKTKEAEICEKIISKPMRAGCDLLTKKYSVDVHPLFEQKFDIWLEEKIPQ